MDVYDLILEHGYLGALEYSSLIDSKNTKLASEIDQIVSGFIRTAQAFAPMQQSAPVQAPVQNIPQATSPSTPPSSPVVTPGLVSTDQTDSRLGAGGIAASLASAGALYFRYKSLRSMIQNVTSQVDFAAFEKAMLELKNNPADLNGSKKNIQIVSEIMAKAPTVAPDLYYKPNSGPEALKRKIHIREVFNKILDAKKLLPEIEADIMHKSVEALTQPRGVREKAYDLAQKKAGLPGWSSPAVKSFAPATPGFGVIVPPNIMRDLELAPLNQSVILGHDPVLENKMYDYLVRFHPDEKAAVKAFLADAQSPLPTMSKDAGKIAKALEGKTVDEAKVLLEQMDAANKTPGKLVGQFETHLLNPTTMDASADALKSAVKSNDNIMTKLLKGALEKLPAAAQGPIKSILGVGAKLLGPLAVALEAKGVYDDYTKYGLDGKTVCEIVSTLLGVATVVGGFATGVIPALWAAVSIGCAFAGHGEAKDSNDKEVDKITEADIDKREETVKITDLSEKDKALATRIYNDNLRNPENINGAFYQSMMNKQFEKPVDVMALAKKQINDGGVFGPATPAAPVEPTAGGELGPKAFNLSQYRLASS